MIHLALGQADYSCQAIYYCSLVVCHTFWKDIIVAHKAKG